MNQRTIVTLFNRHAKHTWICNKCGQNILKNDLYRDQEIKVCTGDTTRIKHRRLCAECAGLIKETKIYKFKGPEPVSAGGIKYYLIGIGYYEGKLRLITEDWVTNRKYWADEVYNTDGERITVKNSEFI